MTAPVTVPTTQPVAGPIPERDVTARRVRFQYSLDDLPEHYAVDGDIVMSHLIAVLSSVFPDGEDFFVRSVRNFRDDVTDPELQKQVKGFIGQEAIHGREHREFNEKLDELGYPSSRIARITAVSLRLREKLLPAKANLALTAALEHYTATLAESILSEPEVRDSIEHPEVRNLFLWHALEESEHKAVAFDVYRAVGGSERMRRITMTVLNWGFPLFLLVATLLSMLGDPVARRSPRKVWQGITRLRRSPVISSDVVERIRDYNRPDFHPDDHDTSALVEAWRAELFGAEGSLNDRLPAAS